MTSLNTSEDPYIGQLVANRLQLKHLIGKGVMGPVYYAEDVAQPGTAYALKLLSPALAASNMRQRFARAAQIGAKLGKKSIHIVEVKAYGIHEDKIPYYVMELLQGKTLKELLKEENVSLNKFFKICRQICLGLQAAHQGIEIKGKTYAVIHRNIKPANIMVTKDSQGGELIKLLDFGIAKLVGDGAGLTQTGSFLGTLAYCSPEQMEGGELNSRSDIYSLGAVMFEMLTGERPWVAENTNSYGVWYKIHLSQPPRAFKDVKPSLEIPTLLEDLVMSCLAKQADKRPQSLDIVLKILEKIENRLNGTSPSTGSDNHNAGTKTLVEKVKASEQLEKVESYIRRAQQYIEMKSWSKAVVELRHGLMLAPNNSTCHRLLGIVYLKQNHLKLAIAHVNKALQLNPQDSKALQLKQILEKLPQKPQSNDTNTPPL